MAEGQTPEMNVQDVISPEVAQAASTPATAPEAAQPLPTVVAEAPVAPSQPEEHNEDQPQAAEARQDEQAEEHEAEGAATTQAETAEQPRTKEVSQERQATEISLVGNNLIHTKQRAIEAKAAQGEALSEGEEKLLEMHNLEQAQDQTFEGIKDEKGDNMGLDLQQGNPIMVRREGILYPVTHLIRKYTDEAGVPMVKCYIKIEEGSMLGHAVPLREFLNAQLVAEKDAVAGSFSNDQRKAVELYAKVLSKGERALDGEDLAALAEQTDKMAQGQGMITAAALETYFAKQPPSPENTAALEQLQKLTEGKNVLDYQTVTAIIKQSGGMEAIADNPLLADYFMQMEEGRIDQQKAKQLTAALQAGDQEKLIEALLTGTAEMSEAELEQKREELRSLLASAGHNLGLILSFLFNALASDEAKVMLKNLK